MAKALTSGELKNIFDSLVAEYDRMSEARNTLESDCTTLLECIDNQVKLIQTLSTDFEKLHQESAGRAQVMQKDTNLSQQSQQQQKPSQPPQPPQPPQSQQQQKPSHQNQQPQSQQPPQQQQKYSQEQYNQSIQQTQQQQQQQQQQLQLQQQQLQLQQQQQIQEQQKPLQQQQQQQNQQQNEEYDISILIPQENIPHPLNIALVAEILDVSVISSTAFSPDGTMLAIGSDKTLRVYNIDKDNFQFHYIFPDIESSDNKTNTNNSSTNSNNNENKNENEAENRSATGTNHIRSLVWSADGSQIISGSEDHVIRVFNFIEGCLVAQFEGGKGEVFQLEISHNSQLLAVVTGDGVLSLWSTANFSKLDTLSRNSSTSSLDVNEKSQQLQLQQNGGVATSLSISDDDKTIAVGYCDCRVCLWDVNMKKMKSSTKCHEMGVYSVKFISHSTKLATSSLDNTVKLWRVNNAEGTLTILKVLEGHSNFVLSLAVDPAGKWLLSGSKDMTAKLTDIEKTEMIYSIKAHNNSVITVSFNSVGGLFCTGSGDNSVKIWSMNKDLTTED